MTHAHHFTSPVLKLQPLLIAEAQFLLTQPIGQQCTDACITADSATATVIDSYDWVTAPCCMTGTL